MKNDRFSVECGVRSAEYRTSFIVHRSSFSVFLFWLLTSGFYLLPSAFCFLPSVFCLASDDLPSREEAAFKAALDRMAPSVVRIETLGGLEKVENVLIGSGSTTGLIVSSDGYIVSSAFNFVQKPSQTLVYLADGTRLPAQIVATDHSRMLVLLKVPTENLDVAKRLPVPVAVPAGEMQVGQWAIAVGRVFEGSRPNVSVGIISALNRVWGKAIQTDAKVSPSNYGGPLADIRGRVLGVLVPMSPQETSELAGVELYDSGIGFAVPLEHVFHVLDRLKSGKDLHPGLVGVSMRSGDPYTDEPIVLKCYPRSPADAAGFKAGDRIVEVGGVKIAAQNEMRRQLAPRYAGDKVSLVVLRGDQRIERTVELVDKLLPYVHPFLGVLPRRDTAGEGVVVREVYADSPASQAGLKPGDRIRSLEGQPVSDRLDLQEKVAALEPLQQVKLEIERDGKSQTLEAKLATLPETVPDELPPARDSQLPADEKAPTTGKFTVKVPELDSEALAYVPSTYNSHVPHGVVVWLHPAGGFKDDELVARWKPLCEAHDLILLAPRSSESAGWQRLDLEFIRKALDEIVQKYNVDRARVIVAGEDTGGAMAYLVTAKNRDIIRGVAAIGAPYPPGVKPPMSDPSDRLAVLTTTAEKSPSAAASDIKRLRDAKHPVTELKLGTQPRSLNADELGILGRWIDTLDRS